MPAAIQWQVTLVEGFTFQAYGYGPTKEYNVHTGVSNFLVFF